MKLARLILPAFALALASGCASIHDVEQLKVNVAELKAASEANAKAAADANSNANVATKQAQQAAAVALNADQRAEAATSEAGEAKKASDGAIAAAKTAEVISYDAKSVSYKLRSDLVDRGTIPGETQKAADAAKQ